jgi:hypothetical protein
MIKHTVQAKNAIKWIDSLKGFKKGVYALGDGDKDGYPTKYCCLGVACRTFNIEPTYWTNETEPSLVGKLGLHDEQGNFFDHQTNRFVERGGVYKIVDMNDELFFKDETFTNVQAFILRHLDVIFVPPVAMKLKEHYGK